MKVPSVDLTVAGQTMQYSKLSLPQKVASAPRHVKHHAHMGRLVIAACATLLFSQGALAAPSDGGADETAASVKLVTLGSMTWSFYDSAAVASYPNESKEVANAMTQAINNYNTMAAYSGNVAVTYVTWSGLTAQASYQGSIQFGYLRSTRTAHHELGHYMGMQPWVNGGKTTWGSLCNGGWQGAIGQARMRSFKPNDGIGCSGDNGHFWDYGMNQDNEFNWLSKGRNIAMVGAIRADIGLSDGSTLPDKPYRLVSRATGTPVADKNAIESGEVIEATSTVSSKQVWTISFNGGYLRFKNAASNRYLDGSGGNALMVSAAPSAAQTWEMIPTSAGYFMLRNQGTDKCLKSVSKTTPGASLQVASCDTAWEPAADFQFHLADLAAPQGSSIVGVASSRCVDVPWISKTNGTQTMLYDCNGGSNQKWTYTANKELKVYGSKCLDAYYALKTNGTKVAIHDCNGGANQKWNLNADGSVTGVDSGLCLDASGWGTANWTPLQLWACHGGANQKWKFK
jgi:Ricin-type beta-trefoil lectin domain/Ricin-type beta-trefoil lectin domain-like